MELAQVDFQRKARGSAFGSAADPKVEIYAVLGFCVIVVKMTFLRTKSMRYVTEFSGVG